MKVLVVIPTKAGVENECFQAVLTQDYPDYGIFVSSLKPIPLDLSPEKNRVHNIVRNRNYARKMALASDAEWFLWVDTDVVLPRNAITEFLKVGKPLMGGWYKKILGSDWVAGRWVSSDTFSHFQKPEQGVVSTDLLGLGCAMIHRSLLERVEFKNGTDVIGKDMSGKSYFLGECMLFCQDSMRLGEKACMVGNVICAHLPVNLRPSH